MLTVKVRESQNDTEVIFEAKQVRKYLNPDRKDGDRAVGTVVCDVEDGKITYDIRSSAPADGSNDQTLYVMNRDGATVAVFHL